MSGNGAAPKPMGHGSTIHIELRRYICGKLVKVNAARLLKASDIYRLDPAAFNVTAFIAHKKVNLSVTVKIHFLTAARTLHNTNPPIVIAELCVYIV